MIKLHKCICGWSYVIGNRRVFGPIFEDGQAINARMMGIEQWEDNYGDCAAAFYSIKKNPHTQKWNK